jgi:hypothetical protein
VTDTTTIRWLWTILTSAGVLYALWNVREVLIDNWAVSQVRTRKAGVVKFQTRGAVHDHFFILGAIAADCVAGVSAILGQPAVALVALIMNAVFLVVLVAAWTYRRRKLFRMLGLKPPKENSPA